MNLFLNPVIVSVILLCFLCIRKVNVLLALIISAIVAGIIAHIPISNIMNTFVSGMGGNSETALSYILLGTFAATMAHTELTNVISNKVFNIIKGNKYRLLFILTIIAVFSQNLIPIHIAFIPIIIPPLIELMNRLKIDRRAVACALSFGLKTPYIVIPAGFGAVFQGLICDNLSQNGLTVQKENIWQSLWILGIAMLVGLLIAIFISYRKPREYKSINIDKQNEDIPKFSKKHAITLLAAFVTFIVQIITESLPLGAISGLSIIFASGVVKHDKTDQMINEGVSLMGYIAFVMLIAAGYAMVLKSTGGIDSLITSIEPLMNGNKFIAALLMLLTGLFITMGIGSSFGTIPILAVLFVPICQSTGFSTTATILLIGAAAALGDAGSPASDTTLGPTAGLNIDGQHNHIKDTCIPTFLHYNIPLIIFALLASILL
ncbi:sodium:proton antiporter [bacterium]|nr:sodium:proton antiporter [bacterium]